jgi:hypothetical protein
MSELEDKMEIKGKTEEQLVRQFKTCERNMQELYPKVHLETRGTVNSQGNSQQKEQCWRYHKTVLQAILQSNSNKNSMVLAQKQT